MYAVFSTGGKQYRASAGDRIKVEKLDADEGATVELGQVLMVGEGEDVNVGSPFVDGGKVTATVVEHGRGEKIKVLKFKRRKHHMKRMGHRQHYTLLEITGIEGAKARSDRGAKPKDDAKADKKVEKKTEAKAEPKASKPKAEAKASKPKAESKDSKKADAKAEPRAEKAKDDGKADD